MSLCLSIRALLTSEDLRGKFLRAAQILDPEWMEYKEANSSLNISTLNAVSFVHFVYTRSYIIFCGKTFLNEIACLGP